MIALIRNLNALIVYILSAILLGAYAVQIFMGEVPCSLCLLQRLGMTGVAFGALLNLRFGLRPAHYAVMLGMAIFGGAVALRQICLHACPSFPTIGIPLWGLSLYTWSFLTFASSFAYVAVRLLLQDRTPDDLPNSDESLCQGGVYFDHPDHPLQYDHHPLRVWLGALQRSLIADH